MKRYFFLAISLLLLVSCSPTEQENYEFMCEIIKENCHTKFYHNLSEILNESPDKYEILCECRGSIIFKLGSDYYEYWRTSRTSSSGAYWNELCYVSSTGKKQVPSSKGLIYPSQEEICVYADIEHDPVFIQLPSKSIKSLPERVMYIENLIAVGNYDAIENLAYSKNRSQFDSLFKDFIYILDFQREDYVDGVDIRRLEIWGETVLNQNQRGFHYDVIFYVDKYGYELNSPKAMFFIKTKNGWKLDLDHHENY